MTSDRKHPTPGFWLTVALVTALVGYPLSVGPACWISSRAGTIIAARTVNRFYRPLTWCVEATHSESLRNGLQWYSRLLAGDGWHWLWTPWMQAGEATWWGGDGSVLMRDLQ